MENIFLEISLVLIVGTLCATIAKFFKQPMIPAYIVAGVILGPFGLNIIKSGDLLETLSTFGIAFLLFLVGIELDLRKFLKTGRVAIFIGVAQMAFAVGVGYLFIRMLGFEDMEALFLAIALGFSSTIIGLKLIGERKELDTLYGQIVIGTMLTQDFIAVLILIFFGVFTNGGDATLIVGIGTAIVKGFFLFSLALLSAKYILTKLFSYFARTGELLFLGAICWCLVFALLSSWLGFSIEVGALIAGVSLSFLPFNYEISYRIRSLRDFFLPIFFAVLGGQLLFNGGESIFTTTIVLSAFVLLASPLLVMFLLLAFGYRKRTAFQAGIAIGQISEFSFIVVHLGESAGVIHHGIVSLVALIGLVTMTLSSYMIEYSDVLYSWVKPLLKKFERKGKSTLDDIPKEMKNHVVLFGYRTLGSRAQQVLTDMKKEVVVIDHSPDVMRTLREQGVEHMYGSMSDEEALEKAHVRNASLILSTVRSREDTVELLEHLKQHRIETPVIVTAFYAPDALLYYTLGASFVLMPTYISADSLPDLLKGKLDTKRKKHLKEMQELHEIFARNKEVKKA